MEVVKLLAALQNINPLLAALDAVADEVLVQINDLKNAGFFYLYIDPYYKPNVTPKASFDLGFEQLRDEGGKRIWITKDGNGNEQETINYKHRIKQEQEDQVEVEERETHYTGNIIEMEQ